MTFVDATSVDNVERALTPATRLVFVETIANPRTQVADLARIGALCRERGLLYVVDNTMTSPWLFRPTTVHAGLIVNALTKYIGGHGNALGGARHRHRPLRLDEVPEHRRQLQERRSRRCGASRRSARRACATGAARWPPSRRITSRSAPRRWRCGWTGNARTRRRSPSTSSRHPKVQRRPLSRACPRIRSTSVRTALFRAPGALLSFELARASTSLRFLNRLRVVVLSSNLGDNRTLAIPVAQTIFWEMGAARRAEMGIADSLIRVSVGIEDGDDLIADFAQALG